MYVHTVYRYIHAVYRHIHAVYRHIHVVYAFQTLVVVMMREESVKQRVE